MKITATVLLVLSFSLSANAQNLIVFNGKSIPNYLSMWAWGQSQPSIVEGAGSGPGKNAIKWIQGDEWSEGWTGFAWSIDPVADLSAVWNTDSLKFKLKSETWSDTIRIQFEAGGKVGIMFVPPGDNQWHEYAFPLRDAVPVEGTTGFDPANIYIFQFIAGNTVGTSVAGSVLYFDDIWTGSPALDFTAPAAPAGLNVVTQTYTNKIIWTDVAGESGERYNVYYGTNPITDVSRADVVKLSVGESVDSVKHELRAPAVDQPVSYYYAITCTDLFGNVSVPTALASPVTATAKGVATISFNAPTSTFVADGDLSEWANITPIHMAPSSGGYTVSWGEPFANDADLTVDAYLAVDATYFYAAFDVTDDIVDYSQPGTNHQDSPDLHIGLYNWHGMSHTSYQRGKEPDYLIRFAQSRVVIDLIANGDSLLVPGPNYYWQTKDLTPGYVIEARIPWALLAEKAGDSVFVPAEGYRIPLDFLFNDADATGDRESMLTYSPNNDGNSWADVSLWLYTWIGNLMNPVGVAQRGEVVSTYWLSQNYPNPFNPGTQITYEIEKPGLVALKVYDLLGRHVATLVNEQQKPGLHTVRFDASRLPSGVYFYQINSGPFSSTRKMMVTK